MSKPIIVELHTAVTVWPDQIKNRIIARYILLGNPRLELAL